MNVVGRLAPSPTGELHLGHAFAFLVAFWSVRSRGGRMILRHEDVDVERASTAHREAIERDLRWLGLDWDEVRIQSEGLARLTERARDLEARGLTYRCECSRSDLRALGAPQAGSTEVRYPGTCREKRLREGGALRFIAGSTPVRFVDRVFGPQEARVDEETGDFVLLRKNGLPSYQLAVTVDDAFDGVTEVCRGADLLASVGRQRQLQEALGLPHVEYLHVPLVVDQEGQRLAKRNDALSLRSLRERGASSASVVGWAAQSAGLSPNGGDARAYLESFDVRRLGTAPIAVDSATLERLLPPRD